MRVMQPDLNPKFCPAAGMRTFVRLPAYHDTIQQTSRRGAKPSTSITRVSHYHASQHIELHDGRARPADLGRTFALVENMSPDSRHLLCLQSICLMKHEMLTSHSSRLPHPIPYQGSKRGLARRRLAVVGGQKFRRLIEPFAGSAAITITAADMGVAAE